MIRKRRKILGRTAGYVKEAMARVKADELELDDVDEFVMEKLKEDAASGSAGFDEDDIGELIEAIVRLIALLVAWFG